jgi:hypothetical protein
VVEILPCIEVRHYDSLGVPELKKNGRADFPRRPAVVRLIGHRCSLRMELIPAADQGASYIASVVSVTAHSQVINTTRLHDRYQCVSSDGLYSSWWQVSPSQHT